MAQSSPWRPTYSHGGSGAPGFTAVPGTAVGAGLPIAIYGSTASPTMELWIENGTATVIIQSSSGAPDSTGNPPSASWANQQTVTLDSGAVATQAYTYRLHFTMPHWRTYISIIDSGATVTSVVGDIFVPSPSGLGIAPAKAAYPSLTNAQTPGT